MVYRLKNADTALLYRARVSVRDDVDDVDDDRGGTEYFLGLVLELIIKLRYFADQFLNNVSGVGGKLGVEQLGY